MKRHITISVTIAIHMGEMVWAKSPQRFEHFVPDYCKERESYVMIGLLIGISQHRTEKSKYRQQYPDSFQRQWSIIAQTVQHGISAENRYELHRQKAQCACDYSQNHKSCQRLYKPQHSEKCTCFAALFHAITSLRSQQGEQQRHSWAARGKAYISVRSFEQQYISSGHCTSAPAIEARCFL